MKITLNKFNTLNNRYKNKQEKINFKGFDCPEDSFEIKRIYDLSCPICSIPMLQRNQIDIFVKKLNEAKGDKIIQILSKYKKYYHETESKVADILINEAIKNPELNLINLAQNYINKQISLFSYEQSDIIEKIRDYGKNLQDNKKTKYNEIISKYEYIIQNQKEDFNSDEFSKELDAFLPRNFTSRKRIIKLAKNMPNLNSLELQFLINYSGKSNAELASRLLVNSLSTCEHIKPKSLGGKNNTENYLAECNECNSKRNNIPFGQWIASFSNFKNNFREYINIVSKKIESGEISAKYIDYPSDVATTISKETNGKINLQSPKLVLSEQAQEINIDFRINQFEKNLNEKIEKLEKMKELQKRMQNDEEFILMLEFKECKAKQSMLSGQKIKIKQKIEEIEKRIKTYYSNKIEMQELTKKLETNLDKKERTSIKYDICKKKRFVDSLNINQEEETKLGYEKQLQDINSELEKVNKKIDNLAPGVHFASYYQKLADEIKTEIYKLRTLLEKLEKYEDCSSLKQEKLRLIKEKNAKIHELSSIKFPIACSSNNIKFIKEYNDLKLLIERCDIIANMPEIFNEKYHSIDSKIFEFAKAKAQEKIDFLISTSPSIQNRINLDNIEKLAEELKQLYISVAKLDEKEKEYEEIKFEISKFDTLENLNNKLNNIIQQLNAAKEREAAIGIEKRIYELGKEISKRTEINAKFKNHEITKEKFFELINELEEF